MRLYFGLCVAISFAAMCGASTWIALERMYEGPGSAAVAAASRGRAEGGRPLDGRVFGFEIGSSTLADVQAATGRLGFACADRSMSVIMAEARADMRAARSARGADAVSHASERARRRAPSPQVRWACDRVPAERLDLDLAPGTGRLLFVFDAADRPLRQVSFQRTHRDRGGAWRDFQAAEARFTRRFGAPTLMDGAASAGELGPLDPTTRRWDRSGIAAKVSALRLHNRVVVSWEAGLPYAPRVAARR